MMIRRLVLSDYHYHHYDYQFSNHHCFIVSLLIVFHKKWARHYDYEAGAVRLWIQALLPRGGRPACHSSLAITTITSITFTTTASTTFTTITTITFTTISNNDSITTIIIVAAWRRTCHSSPHLLLLPLLLLGMQLYKKSKIRKNLQVADHLPPSLGIAPNYSHFQRASLTAVTNITTKLLLLPLYCHNYYRGYHYHYMIPLLLSPLVC